MPYDSDVPIARTESMAIAEMWAELLEEENIASRVIPANLGDTILVPGQAQWELRVAAADARRAAELLPDQSPPADIAEPDDSRPLRSLARWLIIAVVVFIALMVLVVGARGLG
jgi:hypothetical protein